MNIYQLMFIYMNHHHFPNYVRTARKNAGLSARDLAFLLGQKTAGTISRYESFGRNPTLKSAVLLEVALGTPLTRLVPIFYEEARERIVRQAEALLAHLDSRRDSPLIRTRTHRIRKLVERTKQSMNI